MTAVLIVDDDGQLSGHLAVALTAHRDSLRRNGIPCPPAIEVLRAQCLARHGQARPQFAESEPQPDGEPMAVTYEQAGAALGISERSVRRLVAAGELPAVSVGGARRIRLADLRDYVAGLPAQPRHRPGPVRE